MQKLRNTILCLALLLLLLLAVGCHTEHDPVTDAPVAPTCEEVGWTEGSHCGTCGEIITAQEEIPAIGHTEIKLDAVAPTCTQNGLSEGSYCETCDEMLVLQETVPATGHSAVKDKAIKQTCGRLGRTEGSHCKVCDVVITPCRELPMLPHTFVGYECSECGTFDLSKVEGYASKEAYDFFRTVKNGAVMRKLYDAIDADMIAFHLDKDRDAYENNITDRSEYPIVSWYDYKAYGLTTEEAKTVWSYYRKDHPLYYWFSYYASWNDTYIYVHTVADYMRGVNRMKYNDLVYKSLDEYLAYAKDASSDYDTVLAFYDAIIENNAYGDKLDGVHTATDQWAHSIVGAFKYNTFVCEGYAKLLQILLNLSGIKNQYVAGTNDFRHVWNLIQLDDGRWYWFDATWDDGEYAGGYEYFCVYGSTLSGHTASAQTMSNGDDLHVNMKLPARAQDSFQSAAVVELHESFVYEGNTYRRTSYDTVILISTGNPGTVVARGETLIYQGISYHVN